MKDGPKAMGLRAMREANASQKPARAAKTARPHPKAAQAAKPAPAATRRRQ